MRVLLAAVGTRGDVQPMATLGRALRRRGHAVRLIAPEELGRLAVANELELVDLGIDVAGFMASHADARRSETVTLGRAWRAADALVDRQFAVLLEHAKWADVVLTAGLICAQSSVCAALGKPLRHVVLCSHALPSGAHPPWLLPVMGLPRLANRALWAVAELLLTAWVARAVNRNRRALGLPPAVAASRLSAPPGKLILAADGILSPPPLEYDPTIVETGSWHPESTGELEPELAAFVEAAPTVYVGFGSMSDGTLPAALDDALRDTGVRALVAGAAGALPAGCRAVGEVPHGRLFPKLAGVVHHGGAGTTAAAARAGAPQLLVPHVADQFYWARSVRRLGLGPRAVPRRHLSRAALADGLRRLVEDEAARRRAGELGTRLRQRDGVAEAVALVEALA